MTEEASSQFSHRLSHSFFSFLKTCDMNFRCFNELSSIIYFCSIFNCLDCIMYPFVFLCCLSLPAFNVLNYRTYCYNLLHFLHFNTVTHSLFYSQSHSRVTPSYCQRHSYLQVFTLFIYTLDIFSYFIGFYSIHLHSRIFSYLQLFTLFGYTLYIFSYVLVFYSIHLHTGLYSFTHQTFFRQSEPTCMICDDS